ncbi:MAG: BREX system ATP-binding protein BrxD [Gemmataceae bacterium]
MEPISVRRRRDILDALRRGTVPARGLDQFAVGLGRFEPALAAELDAAAAGGAVFKAVRGEYGAGKTFFARWLQEYAKRRRFAAAEVQVSEAETPLHRLETVYRQAMERLATADSPAGAFRSVLDGWFYGLEEEVLAEGGLAPADPALAARSDALLERRLAEVSRTTPQYALALRAYRAARRAGDEATADGLAAWLAGQPHVGAAAKRAAGLKGDVDHFAALGFLRGLLAVLRDSGYAGLVLDEAETLQRVRGDVRERGLNALRQLADEVDGGRFPGLYLLVTGTPAFFDGPQGVRRLEPLAQRLHVDFGPDPRFDNPRAVQLRLPGFTPDRLADVGARVRDLFAADAAAPDRVRALADDAYVADLARAVAGELGGRAGVAPRLFLRKLVGDVLDRIDQFPDFDPRRHYRLTVTDGELTKAERAARTPATADDIELDP